MDVDEMTKISDLPVEVLEMVFCCLDGKSFVQLNLVCKRWQYIARNMEKVFWNRACLKEIDLCILEELLGYRYTTDVAEIDPVWKCVYKSWYKGYMIQKNEFSTKSFQASVNNPITCIKISGSWILTGHRSGSVYAWSQLTGVMCHVFIHHLCMVTDFALVDILHSGPYGSVDNPWDHHHIISISKDPTVQVNSLLAEGQGLEDELQITLYHSCGLSTIRVFGKLAAVSSSDNTILVFEMEYARTPSHRLALSLVHRIIGPSEIIRSFGFWHDEFQCFCVNGIRKVFSASGDQWQTIIPYMMCRQPNQEGVVVKRASISSSFLFRDKTVFLLTVDGKLLVSIDGRNFHQYFLMATIRTTIVCMALHSSVLALGTENGHLLLYYVPRVADLLKLNLSQPSLSSYLSEASIVAIDIVDSDESPVVVACTTESIFIIKWYRPENVFVQDRDISCLFPQQLLYNSEHQKYNVPE